MMMTPRCTVPVLSLIHISPAVNAGFGSMPRRVGSLDPAAFPRLDPIKTPRRTPDCNEYGGKFSMFLEAAELSGFKPILDGKSVATVMAPDNDAFAAYLEENGYVSVKDIPTDDLKKLIRCV